MTRMTLRLLMKSPAILFFRLLNLNLEMRLILNLKRKIFVMKIRDQM